MFLGNVVFILIVQSKIKDRLCFIAFQGNFLDINLSKLREWHPISLFLLRGIEWQNNDVERKAYFCEERRIPRIHISVIHLPLKMETRMIFQISNTTFPKISFYCSFLSSFFIFYILFL